MAVRNVIGPFIESLTASGAKVVLDFEGVRTISHSAIRACGLVEQILPRQCDFLSEKIERGIGVPSGMRLHPQTG